MTEGEAARPALRGIVVPPRMVLEERDVNPPLVTTGRAAIGAHLEEPTRDGVLLIDPAGHPILFAGYVAEPVFLDGTPYVLVLRISQQGEIQHQWVF